MSGSPRRAGWGHGVGAAALAGRGIQPGDTGGPSFGSATGVSPRGRAHIAKACVCEYELLRRASGTRAWIRAAQRGVIVIRNSTVLARPDCLTRMTWTPGASGAWRLISPPAWASTCSPKASTIAPTGTLTVKVSPAVAVRGTRIPVLGTSSPGDERGGIGWRCAGSGAPPAGADGVGAVAGEEAAQLPVPIAAENANHMAKRRRNRSKARTPALVLEAKRTSNPPPCRPRQSDWRIRPGTDARRAAARLMLRCRRTRRRARRG